MSKWAKVGEWIKDNAGTGAALVGSMLTGNVAGAVASGVALVSSATGSDDPEKALEQLQGNPEALIKLKQLTIDNEKSIREHIESMHRLELEDGQHQHLETQKTIRAGDASLDEKIRMFRPARAKESWVATIGYCLACFGVRAVTGNDIFDIVMAGLLSSPALGYMGLRTADKIWQKNAK
jgi:hypothetical protein